MRERPTAAAELEELRARGRRKACAAAAGRWDVFAGDHLTCQQAHDIETTVAAAGHRPTTALFWRLCLHLATDTDLPR
ncbi:MAG: hypothetical protein S0880_10380 [Actinomycetota bacterium]|nr:hypothetical protein [Actinomycetota bacterium]